MEKKRIIKNRTFIILALIIVLGIAFFILKLLLSDTAPVSLPYTKQIDFKINRLDEYSLSATIGDSYYLNSPKGICIIEQSLFVVDSGNNRLVEFDLNGNFVREIGKKGEGKVEFINPTGITADKNNNLYILDSGNGRIQVLDRNGNFIRQINVNNQRMIDIALDENNNIYTSVDTHDLSKAYIYVINPNGGMKKIGKGLNGYLTSTSEGVYFASFMELPPKKDSQSLNEKSGISHLLKITPNGFTNICQLPLYYYSGDLLYINNNLYLLSKGMVILDKYDLEGNYKGTSFKPDIREYKGMTYMAASSDNIIYISDTSKNLIYKLDKIK